MTRFSRRLLAGALALSVGLVVAACGPVQAGAAATVGNDRITTATLDAAIARAMANETAAKAIGNDKMGFTRYTLGQLINHQVLAKAAADKGVTVTESAVDAELSKFITQAGSEDTFYNGVAEQGIAKEDVRGLLRDLLLGDALGAELTKDIKITEIESAHILFAEADKAKAEAVLAEVKADPTKFAALAKQYSTDEGSKENGGNLGFQTPDAFVGEFGDALTKGEPGTFALVHTEFGWHVVHIIAKKEVAVSELGADSQEAQSILKSKLTEYLTSVAKEMKIKVSSRYGTWDAATSTVVAAESDVTSPAPKDSMPVSSPAPDSSTPTP